MSSQNAPIIVVGAGIGGLSAAIHLAASGRRVELLEQHRIVGGKMGRLTQDGYRWDTGPSVITMRHVLEALFEKAGRRLEDYVTLQPVEPITRYLYPDGTVIDATRDLPRMAEQIAALDARDVAGYLHFLAHAAELHRITTPIFIEGQPPTVKDIFRVPLRDMLKVDAWRTMDAAIRRWIHAPHLRDLLRRYATYVGASPYRAPAVLNVIAHTELTSGIWYPQGGIYELARAYRDLAVDLGVDLRTGCRVDRILVEDGRVCGVRTADDAEIQAHAVVSNVDVTTTYHSLLPSGVGKRRRRRLTRREPSISGFVLLLGLRGITPGLVQHNILFPSDYRREFADIFSEGRPPREPAIYITISSRVDADHAPEGCENWFVLVNMPPIGPAFDWERDAAVSACRDRILDRIEAMGYEVRGRIQTESRLTPKDLQHRTGAWRGALYGLSSNHPLNALRRPNPRSPDVRGLYFVGGTTHPGGGVPMVTLSGGVAAGMVQEDLRE